MIYIAYLVYLFIIFLIVKIANFYVSFYLCMCAVATDLAVIIIHRHPELISFVNDDGLTPLKMLAAKPLAFKSSSNFGWWNNLLYHCKY